MAVNHFDQASRYTAKLDPLGLLDWLVPGWRQSALFVGWLETRTIPFPGEADRVCDTVAHLLADDQAWALVLEFQSRIDSDLFGRLLEYLGRLWIELKPAKGARYCVAAAVINLTGNGATSKDMQFSATGVETRLAVAEKNLASENARETLERIEAGEWCHCLLPWIPLMQGGDDPAIIATWKSLAGQEPDHRRRDEYAGLALVFSDLTACRKMWHHALEDWNVELSPTVLEWEKKWEQRSKLQGKREMLLRLLERRFPAQISSGLADQVGKLNETQVDAWSDQVVTAETLAKLLQNVAAG